MIIFSLIRIENLLFIFSKNWYDKLENEEFKWMNNYGTVSLFYFEESSKKVILNFNILPLFEKKSVLFFLNDRLINTFDIVKDGGWVHTKPLNLNVGEHVLMFHSKEGCIIIADKLENDDMRCVSLTLRNITLS